MSGDKDKANIANTQIPSVLEPVPNQKGIFRYIDISEEKPLSVHMEIGEPQLDKEGRCIILEYENFILINVYVPNAESGLERKEVRANWDKAFLKYVKSLEKPLIICGDFNVARESIDIYPENLRNIPDPPGFQPDERHAMEKLLDTANLYDVFRTLNPGGIGYTWWSSRMRKRLEDRGWRLDYFLVSHKLIGDVKSIRHMTEVYGSDHCPVDCNINIWQPKPAKTIDDENAAEMWRGIDWDVMERQLLTLQQKLARAVLHGNDEGRIELQKRIVRSMAAKVLAVRRVANSGTAAGIDGVKWITDEEKMKAALSLTSKGYQARPYRLIIIKDKGKDRRINVPTAYDKAMHILYSYALDPVAETTGGGTSFAFRRGRSSFDCNEYICEVLDGDNAPQWVFKGDVKSCYDTISHRWLLNNIPMDRKVLSKFLNAGTIMNGLLFPTEEGITQGGSLSPIIGNMTLDGLQDFLYERLFPDGAIDHTDGYLIRFADDILVTARTGSRAEEVRRIVVEFLAKRGLLLSDEKSKIINVKDGFEFLSRWYWKEDGMLQVKPSQRAIRILEDTLEEYILDYKGNLRTFIETLNRKLKGWANYHRVTNANETFRQLDTVVHSLLLKKMRLLYPKRPLKSITSLYWHKDAKGRQVFSMPTKRHISVILLQDINVVMHQKVRTNYNPYLDYDYYDKLIRRREVDKVSGEKYKTIWQRQQGMCYLCGKPMLSDHMLEIIQIGYYAGRNWDNLAYAHKKCAKNTNLEFITGDRQSGVDILDVLEEVIKEETAPDDPYYNLRLFFYNCVGSSITLTFEEIERIIGDSLDWEAYFCEAFWYDEAPGFTNEKWLDDYPFHAIQPGERKYCIAQAWISQGYVIQRLRLLEKRVIFRKKKHGISGIDLPKELFEKKLPKDAVYEIEEFVKATLKKYGV